MRSLAVHAVAPKAALPTDEPALRIGAEHYAEMCAGCHLASGADDRDLHDGLYPRPPDFTTVRAEPGVAFWTIKHGIKMTGMSAWGRSHDDARLRKSRPGAMPFIRASSRFGNQSMRRGRVSQLMWVNEPRYPAHNLIP